MSTENSIEWPTMAKPSHLWNLFSSNIKKVSDFASLTVWDYENGIGQPTTSKTVIDTWPDLIRLEWSPKTAFNGQQWQKPLKKLSQTSYIWNEISKTVFKILHLVSLMVWDRRKQHWMANNRKKRSWKSARSAILVVRFPKPSLKFV